MGRHEKAGEVVGPQVLGDLAGKDEIDAAVGDVGEVPQRALDELDALGQRLRGLANFSTRM